MKRRIARPSPAPKDSACVSTIAPATRRGDRGDALEREQRVAHVVEDAEVQDDVERSRSRRASHVQQVGDHDLDLAPSTPRAEVEPVRARSERLRGLPELGLLRRRRSRKCARPSEGRARPVSAAIGHVVSDRARRRARRRGDSAAHARSSASVSEPTSSDTTLPRLRYAAMRPCSSSAARMAPAVLQRAVAVRTDAARFRLEDCTIPANGGPGQKGTASTRARRELGGIGGGHGRRPSSLPAPGRGRAGRPSGATTTGAAEYAARREGGDPRGRSGLAAQRGDDAQAQADGRDRRQADPLAHHEDLRRARRRRVRRLPRLQGLRHQGVVRQLRAAHVAT